MIELQRDMDRELDEHGVISEGLAWRLMDALNEAENQCLDVNVAMKRALDRCRRLAALWASMPGSSHGLPANAMTNDCAAFWLDVAITGEDVRP